MNWHIKLKEYIYSMKSSNKPLEFKYEGINWGLGCNSIHFINLVSWFSKEKPTKVIERSINKWMPAKEKDILSHLEVYLLNLVKEVVCS